MTQRSEQEAPPPGTGAHPTVEEPGTPEAEVGSTVDGGPADRGDAAEPRRSDVSGSGRPASERIQGGPAEDVAATGTALRPGERESGLDLEDAPGTAGPGAG